MTKTMPPRMESMRSRAYAKISKILRKAQISRTLRHNLAHLDPRTFVSASCLDRGLCSLRSCQQVGRQWVARLMPESRRQGTQAFLAPWHFKEEPWAPASYRGGHTGECMVFSVIHHVEAMNVDRLFDAVTRAYAKIRVQHSGN